MERLKMVGDFILFVRDYVKALVKDASTFIKENTCIHKYKECYYAKGVVYGCKLTCKKCGRVRFK